MDNLRSFRLYIVERLAPSVLVENLLQGGAHVGLKRLQLYGGVQLCVCTTLALIESPLSTEVLWFFAALVLSTIPSLFNRWRFSLLLNMMLVVLSFLSMAQGFLPQSWCIAGIVVGGYVTFCIWMLSFMVLMRNESAQVLPRLLLFMHMIFLPVQLVALSYTAISIKHDKFSVLTQIEGAAWIFVSLSMGYFTSSILNALQPGGPPPPTALFSKTIVFTLASEFALSVVMGSRVIMATITSNSQDWLHFLWLTVLTQAACFVFIGTVLTVLCCLVAREGLLRETFVDLFGGDFIHSTSFTYLASSPASLILTPFVYHFAVTFIPLIIVLGHGLVQNSVPDHINLILGDLLLGVVVVLLLWISTILESQRPGHLLRGAFLINMLVAITGLCFHSFSVVALMEGKGHTLVWDMADGSMVVFWEVFVVFVGWAMASAASRHISGELWSHVTCGSLLSGYYSGDDAKESSEALAASLIGGLITTFLLFSMDLTALVTCGRRDNCSSHVFGTLAAACLSNTVWLIFTLIFVALIRFRGPLTFVLPVRCCRAEARLTHIWVSDIFNHCSELLQFVLMVVMFTYACGTDERARGKTRALMITSATLRLIAFVPMVIIDIASREERRNAYTNALGTSVLMQMQHSTATNTRNQHPGGFGEDVETAHYGTIGSYTLEGNSVEARTGRLRGELSKLRVLWENGHEVLMFNRSSVLEEAVEAFMNLEASLFYRTFRFDFIEEKGLDAGGIAREFVAVVSEGLVKSGYFKAVDAEDGELMRYQITPHPNPSRLSKKQLNTYRFAGRFFGKALFDGHTNLRLARPLYGVLLGEEAKFEDLKEYDAPLYRQLVALEATDDNIEDLCLDFSVAYNMEDWGVGGERTVVISLEDQSSEPPRDVTKENVREYVELRWRRRVCKDIAAQLEAFLQGLDEVFPRPMLKVFDRSELELLMAGVDVIDVSNWKSHSRYQGDFTAPRGRLSMGTQSHPSRVVGWFWDYVGNLSQTDRQRLLRFTTGSSGVPVGGFAQLLGNDGRVALFTLQSLPLEEGGHNLPRAHTCFNRIDLPLYQSKEQLIEKFNQVISSDLAITGFGID